MKVTLKNIKEFGAEKQRLLTKYGEKLISGQPADTAGILKDCAAMAAYAKVPPEKMHTLLMKELIHQQTPAGDTKK